METKKGKAWPVMVAMVTVLGLLLSGPVWAEREPDANLAAPGSLPQGDDLLISRAEGTMRGRVAAAYNDDLDEYLVVWSDGRDLTDTDIYGQRFAGNGLLVGGNLVIRNEGNILLAPDVAYDTFNERYLVVWEDGTEDDIEGQLLNGDGTPYGAAINVSEGDASAPRAEPAVAFHGPTGAYLVVFRQGLNGSYDVMGKQVTAAGTVGSANYSFSTAAGNQTGPDVSADPSSEGDFLVVWEDGRDSVSSIWGCIMFAATKFLGIEFEIGSTSTPRSNPAVTFSPAAGTAGEWLVVFQRNVDGDQQIGARRLAADGTVTGGGIYVSNDAGNQVDPQVAYSGAEQRYLVAWEDTRNGGTDPDIYARAVDNAGTPLDDSFPVQSAAGYQIDPAVVMSTSGSIGLVIYREGQTDDIEARRVSTSFGSVSSSIVMSAPLGQQVGAAVAYNSQDGQWLVVWRDTRAGNSDIFGQRLDRTGSLLGRNFAICPDPAGQFLPAVAYNLDTNQFLVVWEDRRTDADIYGRRVNADGTLDGAEFVVAGDGNTPRRRPQLTFNPLSGEFFVVYIYEAGNNDVRARRVPPGGAPSTAEIAVAATAADENYAGVACRSLEPGGGGYLVVWQETSSLQPDLKAKRFDRDGVLLGALDVCTEASSQGRPRLAYNPDDDRYLVAWSDDRSLTSQGRNLYGRQIGGTGALYPEFAISTAAGDQTSPQLAYGQGIGRYVVVWEDARTPSLSPDVYGQQVLGTGSLTGTGAEVNDKINATVSYGQGDPAVAWSDAGEGLAVWEDGRAGGSVYRIYGRPLLAEAGPGHRTFLPLIVQH